MSDIVVKCVQCGKEISVSEFVDPDVLKCADCGAQLVLPRRHRSPMPTTVRHKKPSPEEVAAAEAAAAEQQPASRRQRRQRRRQAAKRKQQSTMVRLGEWKLSQYAGSWLIFIILGGVLCSFRYSDLLTEEALFSFTQYGMIGLSVLYAVVVIEALKEEFFDGMLCLFIPPYIIYYLFAKSDTFILRATVAAGTAAFGYDLYAFIFHHAMTFIDWATWRIGQGA